MAMFVTFEMIGLLSSYFALNNSKIVVVLVNAALTIIPLVFPLFWWTTLFVQQLHMRKCYTFCANKHQQVPYAAQQDFNNGSEL